MNNVKALKYLGKINNVDQFEEYEIEQTIIEPIYDYNLLITELIREKYSQDDEFALNSKSMQMYFNNCTEEQRAKWMIEIKEFTNYRQQCIAMAKQICKL